MIQKATFQKTKHHVRALFSMCCNITGEHVNYMHQNKVIMLFNFIFSMPQKTVINNNSREANF